MAQVDLPSNDEHQIGKVLVMNEADVEFVVSSGSDITFYNPAQKINRDLSSLAICSFVDNFPDNRTELSIADATSATGLRIIRYIKNLLKPIFQRSINICGTALDLNQSAISIAKQNISNNNLNDFIDVKCCDSIKYLGTEGNEFDVIDIDPYGTFMPFLESTLKACRSKPFSSLLCLTSTDMRILLKSNQMECFRRYDMHFPRIYCNKEVGLRMLLQIINLKSINHNLFMRPLLSLSSGHYIRLFIELTHSAQKSIQNLKYSSYGSFCYNCSSVKLNSIAKYSPIFRSKIQLKNLDCKICKNPSVEIGGRLWSGPLHCSHFLDKMLKFSTQIDLDDPSRCQSIIQVLKDELDIPFSFSLEQISRKLKIEMPRLNHMIELLEINSYKWSFCFSDPECIKTDAPYDHFIKLIASTANEKSKDRVFNALSDLLIDASNQENDGNHFNSEKSLEPCHDKDQDYVLKRKVLLCAIKEGQYKGPITAIKK